MGSVTFPKLFLIIFNLQVSRGIWTRHQGKLHVHASTINPRLNQYTVSISSNSSVECNEVCCLFFSSLPFTRCYDVCRCDYSVRPHLSRCRGRCCRLGAVVSVLARRCWRIPRGAGAFPSVLESSSRRWRPLVLTMSPRVLHDVNAIFTAQHNTESCLERSACSVRAHIITMINVQSTAFCTRRKFQCRKIQKKT